MSSVSGGDQFVGYRVEFGPRGEGEFGAYRYNIYRDGALVARYGHDHRADEHWIDFADGRRDEWPVGRSVDFLEGGGPELLRLTRAGERYMDVKLAEAGAPG